MCVCVCVTKWARRAVAEPFVTQLSFWLIWKVNSSSLTGCKKFCRVTWPWPIYLAPTWPTRPKSRFFTMFSRFVRKRTEISKWLRWTAIRKEYMGFPTTPKSAPQLDSFAHLGGRKHEKNAKNGFYHFQRIKLHRRRHHIVRGARAPPFLASGGQRGAHFLS